MSETLTVILGNLIIFCTSISLILAIIYGIVHKITLTSNVYIVFLVIFVLSFIATLVFEPMLTANFSKFKSINYFYEYKDNDYFYSLNNNFGNIYYNFKYYFYLITMYVIRWVGVVLVLSIIIVFLSSSESSNRIDHCSNQGLALRDLKRRVSDISGKKR